MGEPLFEVLSAEFDNGINSATVSDGNKTVKEYLEYLPTLSIDRISTAEPTALAASSDSLLRSLRALSAKSQKNVIASSESLAGLSTNVQEIAGHAGALHVAVPRLDDSAEKFADAVGKLSKSPILERRRTAMLLSRNVDRLSDILELPVLLSSAISSAATPASSSASSSANTAYTLALDLYAHINRLKVLYPNSDIVKSIGEQAEEAMRSLTTNLIASLRTQGVKLASGMRTIGWLRRVAPELENTGKTGNSDHALGALLLVCRLANLEVMFEALRPLRDLADQESERRLKLKGDTAEWNGGQQTERYLKRYIEIFREQSFAIISMFNSIFPKKQLKAETSTLGDSLSELPSSLATFPLFMVDMLSDTLKQYLPNVGDKAARESLLTQVLYCAGSLGRLGGDFGMILSCLEEDIDGDIDTSDEETLKARQAKENEWVDVIKKHRILAGRLEKLASGTSQKKTAV
jgi:hypothetical protein